MTVTARFAFKHLGWLVAFPALVVCGATSASAATGGPFRFDFGPGTVQSGYTQVLQSAAYTIPRGYGFGDVTKVASRDRGAPDALRRDFCLPNGTDFKVDMINGDYTVRVISGDQIAVSTMTVKAEGISKLTNVGGAAGTFADVTFTVAVIDGQLNLEFVGTVPRVNVVEITRLPARTAGARPNVYIAGDSTVMSYNSSFFPQQGWGARIASNFTTDVTFTNRAIGGRSSKSFVLDGRLDSILTAIRPNDFLFIQFGHNDASSVPERHTDPFTTYKQFLKMYVDGARQRGAIPVLITPVGRRSTNSDGSFKNDFPDYTTAMKQLATDQNVKLIDLMTASIELYNSIGFAATTGIFLWLEPGQFPNFPNGVHDSTHFQENGAREIARLVASGVLQINVPISRFVR